MACGLMGCERDREVESDRANLEMQMAATQQVEVPRNR